MDNFRLYFSILSCVCFSCALITNYLYLKRWRDKMILRDIAYLFFTVVITFFNWVMAWDYGEVHEYIVNSYYENTLYENSDLGLQWFLLLHVAYFLLLLLLSAIITIETFINKNLKNKLLIASMVLIFLFVFCAMICIVFDVQTNNNKTFSVSVLYLSLAFILIDFMFFLLYKDKNRKLLLTIIGVSIFGFLVFNFFTFFDWVDYRNFFAYPLTGGIAIGLLLLRYKKLKRETVK
jgi:hypothetical protein